MLMQVGHPLDFDWKAAQKGKGRNSDVDTVGGFTPARSGVRQGAARRRVRFVRARIRGARLAPAPIAAW